MNHKERAEEPADGPTGLFIIRAWIEHGSSEPLRAQVRMTTDVSSGFDRVLSLTQTDVVCATVRDWLAGMLEQTEPAPAAEN